MKKYSVISCECGAVTVYNEETRQQVSMPRSIYKKVFLPNIPPIEIDDDFDANGNCNHCVNHWGVTLCACGSGKQFNKCKEGLPECGRPYYDINIIF